VRPLPRELRSWDTFGKVSRKEDKLTLSKAIEILEDILHHVRPGDPPDEHDAIKLGVEALKTIRELRELIITKQSICLPGETPE